MGSTFGHGGHIDTPFTVVISSSYFTVGIESNGNTLIRIGYAEYWNGFITLQDHVVTENIGHL
jgi:hypothetical protein